VYDNYTFLHLTPSWVHLSFLLRKALLLVVRKCVGECLLDRTELEVKDALSLACIVLEQNWFRVRAARVTLRKLLSERWRIKLVHNVKNLLVVQGSFENTNRG
jgi:hypothetical protein